MTLLVRLAVAAGGLGLAALIALAIPRSGPLAEEVGALLAPAWGAVTLADLYLGFFVAAAVIVAVEKDTRVGFAWALPIFVLGNVVTAAWAVWRLPRLVAFGRR